MTPQNQERGREELRQARRKSRSLFWLVGLFSVFANLLMLTGPIYMLQVYDRVLGSRSVETLIALSALVAFLYLVMGVLDYSRGRIMGRAAARFQSELDQRIFDAVIRKSSVVSDDNTNAGLRDLEAIQRLMSSPLLLAFFDLPWTPIFLLGIYIFHPWLGFFAICGGLVLVLITIVNQIVTKRPVGQSNRTSTLADMLGDRLRAEAETIQALGMRDAAFRHWNNWRNQSLSHQIRSADFSGTFSSLTKTFRLFLQSAMLGLGAYLVLKGEMTAGGMIAGSILLGRALAPIEQLVGQWQLVQRALKGWSNLADLLAEIGPERFPVELPRPKARLDVKGLTLFAPGERQPTLSNISFTLEEGQAIGVIGASGAGKSTLVRAITGVWRPSSGLIQLDGASLDQYSSKDLGEYFGYLPQRIQLFDGTIAENIARLSKSTNDAAVVEAARQADAHDMILGMPNGYSTLIRSGTGSLSGGQIQRIGLARALYGNPVVLILDEPNSNLDHEGSEAVNATIRRFKAIGKSVLIVAHRPAAIAECDTLLVLEKGKLRAFGAKDRVLGEVVKNHANF